jgi:hypothetical protein
MPLMGPGPDGSLKAYYGGDLLSVASVLLYDTELMSILPVLVTSTAAGNVEPLANIYGLIANSFADIPIVTNTAVICAEEASFATRDEITQMVTNYDRPLWKQLSRALSYPDQCDVFPVNSVDPSFKSPVVSDVPVLLLSGAHDAITPTAWARLTEMSLTRATLVEAGDSAHGTFNSDCVATIARTFIANPSNNVDMSCLDGLEPPPFFIPETAQASTSASKVGKGIKVVASDSIALEDRPGVMERLDRVLRSIRR